MCFWLNSLSTRCQMFILNFSIKFPFDEMFARPNVLLIKCHRRPSALGHLVEWTCEISHAQNLRASLVLSYSLSSFCSPCLFLIQIFLIKRELKLERITFDPSFMNKCDKIATWAGNMPTNLHLVTFVHRREDR